MLLRLVHAGAGDLPAEPFVKFSRDFDDTIRDPGRDQPALEVRFDLLSRVADFPIPVPACRFADDHHASGTGLLVTARVPSGVGPVERAHRRCVVLARRCRPAALRADGLGPR